MSKKSLRFALLGIFVAAALGAGDVRGEDPVLPAPFAVLDADGNGVISEAEFVAHAVAKARTEFRRLDGDGDGKLGTGDVDGERAAALAPAPAPAQKAGRAPLGLRLVRGDEERREALRKRVTAGPSLRQGGR